MKKAETLKEVYHIFKPNNTITEETREFYVDIFKESMQRFVFDLENLDNPRETYLIAGQSGNGKSSALNMLSINYPKINEMYDFKYIVGRKNFEYLDKIDVADVLFNIAHAIIADDEELFDEFTRSLEKIYNPYSEELYSNIGIGRSILDIFKSKVNFNTSYGLNNEVVKSSKELFKFKKQEIIKIINNTIFSYKIKYKKSLIVIIDDLEKREDINHFYMNSENKQPQLVILNELNLIKIITMPIHITFNKYIKFGEVKKFGLKLKQSNGDINQKDRDLLKDVISKRVKNNSLFKEKVIDNIIDMSGGNIRQLIHLIHKGAMEAILVDSNFLDKKNINKSIQGLEREFTSFIMNQIKFLNRIQLNNIVIDSDEDLKILEKAISYNVIFPYFNGNTWFELNPIYLRSLKFYNNKLNKQFQKEYYKSNLPLKNNYINTIKINNYFSIRHIELENLQDKKEIYFVGENGDGKTILLQALALAYKDNSNYPILANKYLKTLKKPFSLETEDKFINDNLFAYGINRNKTNADDVDSSGYASLFDTPSINDTTSFNRPQDLFILANDITKEFIEGLEYLLENKIKIIQVTNETKFYETSNENIEIEFKMLSEGYKSTIIWLSDLLFRLIKKQAKITKLKDFKAVILIDEIDLYLHPKWKYQFVHRLRKMFPKIQFIMTTHSITTILGARDDAVFYQVYKDEEGYTQLSEEINDISDYSANILLTSPMFNMQSAKSRAYDDKENSLSDDDYREHQLNKNIDKMLESDDSKKIKLDILAQLKAL